MNLLFTKRIHSLSSWSILESIHVKVDQSPQLIWRFRGLDDINVKDVQVHGLAAGASLLAKYGFALIAESQSFFAAVRAVN